MSRLRDCLSAWDVIAGASAIFVVAYELSRGAFLPPWSHRTGLALAGLLLLLVAVGQVMASCHGRAEDLG